MVIQLVQHLLLKKLILSSLKETLFLCTIVTDGDQALPDTAELEDWGGMRDAMGMPPMRREILSFLSHWLMQALIFFCQPLFISQDAQMTELLESLP